MYYVFDALEIIMGPYDSYKDAESDMDLMVTECYLEDDYPNPYVDYIEEGDQNARDRYWYGSCEDNPPTTRERIIKRKQENV